MYVVKNHLKDPLSYLFECGLVVSYWSYRGRGLEYKSKPLNSVSLFREKFNVMSAPILIRISLLLFFFKFVFFKILSRNQEKIYPGGRRGEVGPPLGRCTNITECSFLYNYAIYIQNINKKVKYTWSRRTRFLSHCSL